LLDVDGAKASTASDALDVLPTACAFIAVMCKKRNRKNRTVYLRLKTEPHRTKFEKSEATSPSCYRTVIYMRPKNSYINSEKLECGPMPNLMVSLPNIGGALSSTPRSLANTHY